MVATVTPMPAVSSHTFTWDARYPRDFESLWWVVLRVCLVNFCSINDLIRMTWDNDENKRDLHRNACLNINLIDIKKLGLLLQIDEARLAQGSLEHMLGRTSNRSHWVRFCEKCLVHHDYHCAFFDLPIVKCCPVHGCELTQGCDKCINELFLQPRLFNSGLVRGCRYCGRTLRFSSQISYNELSHAGFEVKIGIACRELLNWWKAAQTEVPCSALLLKNVLARESSNLSGRGPKFIDVELGLAEAHVGKPASWEFIVDAVASKHSACQIYPDLDPPPLVRSLTGPSDIRDDKLYRSLRRFFYRRYVRKNRAEYYKLVNLEVPESLSIRSDKLCLPALTFAIWRMAHERRLPRWLSLDSRQKYSLLSAQLVPKLSAKLMLSYASFFSIWRQLERFGQSGPYRIVFEYDGTRRDYLWAYAHKTDECSKNPAEQYLYVALEEQDSPNPSIFPALIQHLIFPDPAHFAPSFTRKEELLGIEASPDTFEDREKFIEWLRRAGEVKGICFQVNSLWKDGHSEEPFKYLYI